MGPDDLPENVKQLMRERIESFEQLEALVLLGKDRNREWTSELVAAELKVQPPIAAAALTHLRQRGLLAVSGSSGFVCRPATAELEVALKELVDAYRNNPIAVIQRMSSNAVERVRGSAIRMFADAFLVGRGRKDG